MCREYYVNDAGNQIVNLGKSLQARYREHLGLDFDLPEDGYHGEDVKNIAIAIAEEYKDAYVEYSDANLKFFKEKGIAFELDKIRRAGQRNSVRHPRRPLHRVHEWLPRFQDACSS